MTVCAAHQAFTMSHALRFLLHSGCASLIAATASLVAPQAQAAPISLLNSGGFENPADILPSALRLTWGPEVYGKWGVGDAMSAVGVKNGIAPQEGVRMLEFNADFGVAADIYQLVDVSAWSADIDANRATADIAVYFNAVGAGSQGMTLSAFRNAPLSFSNVQLLAGGVFSLAVDGDRSTWQEFGLAGTPIPAGTRFLMFGVHGNNFAATSYADNARLLLNTASAPIPEPTTALLASLGLALAGWSTQRRRVRAAGPHPQK